MTQYRFAYTHLYTDAELRVGVEADTAEEAAVQASEKIRHLVRAIRLDARREEDRMTLRPQTERAVHQILDTFSGGDTSFVDFKVLLEVMDQRADEGDKVAQRIVDIVLNMGSLLEVAARRGSQVRMDDGAWQPATTLMAVEPKADKPDPANEWPDYTE